MSERRLIEYLDSYPDFPEKGVLFRDVLPLLQEPALVKGLINKLSALKIIKTADAIVAIDARGFIFGTAIALISKKPLIAARKVGKLPGELICNSYHLEYGENTLCIQKKSIKKYNSFGIVDDLLATGGTASAIEKLLLSQGKIITGLCVVVVGTVEAMYRGCSQFVEGIKSTCSKQTPTVQTPGILHCFPVGGFFIAPHSQY